LERRAARGNVGEALFLCDHVSVDELGDGGVLRSEFQALRLGMWSYNAGLARIVGRMEKSLFNQAAACEKIFRLQPWH
jgi:hypothetical protein